LHGRADISGVILFVRVWWQFKTEETANIMKDFDEPGHLAPTGLFLGPTKYMVIQGEPGAVIRGKKVMHDCPSPLLISVSAFFFELNFLPYSCSHVCVSIERAG